MARREVIQPGINPRTYLWSMVAILLLATALRVYALEADLPLHISLSQGPTTDGAVTVGAARDKVLFGSWCPFPTPIDLYPRFPAMSWLAFLFFRTLGVGYWQANLVSAATGLLSIVLIAAFARQQLGRRVSLFSALFMATNYVYVMYNRIPMVYTTLACGMALALYCWGKGLRDSRWFFLSGAVTAFSIEFIKVLGLSFLLAALAGLAILAYRRRRMGQASVAGPSIFFSAGVLLVTLLWLAFVLFFQSETLSIYYEQVRSFDAAYGWQENVRFVVQSVLQFGVRSGIVLRMLLLMILAYAYTFYRMVGLLSPGRLSWPSMGESMALLALCGAALVLLGSANRPTRYLIVLVPPTSLAAALALDRWLQQTHLRLPARPSRLLSAVVLVGFTYLFYQVLAALIKLVRTIALRTGLADQRLILEGNTLFAILFVSMALALGATLLVLQQTIKRQGRPIALPVPPMRKYMALALIAGIVGADLYQYGMWAISPEYSIVEASRQAGQDLGPGAVLGGAYAYVLALENQTPAILFYWFTSPEAVLSSHFTHLAVDTAGPPGQGAFNDEGMFQTMPGLMQRASLVKTYKLRGYLVKLYEIEK
jgi:4-amino-4-deoxy-L-arabinose transferase-like glycosyltransferase